MSYQSLEELVLGLAIIYVRIAPVYSEWVDTIIKGVAIDG